MWLGTDTLLNTLTPLRQTEILQLLSLLTNCDDSSSTEVEDVLVVEGHGADPAPETATVVAELDAHSALHCSVGLGVEPTVFVVGADVAPFDPSVRSPQQHGDLSPWRGVLNLPAAQLDQRRSVELLAEESALRQVSHSAVGDAERLLLTALERRACCRRSATRRISLSTMISFKIRRSSSILSASR